MPVSGEAAVPTAGMNLARSASTMPYRPRLTILGVAIDDLSVADAIGLLTAAAKDETPRTVYFANAHTLNCAAEADDYARLLNRADAVFGDGTGVRWAARLQSIRLQANLNGTDLIPAFMAATDREGLRYYLLGATQEIVERTAAVTRQRFPGWTLTGVHHGYLDDASTDATVAAINTAAPHVLLVAMGNPIQERWIHVNRAKLQVNLCIAVGGLFAYLSGDYRRAPLWMRKAGLEWLGVSVMQPRKIGRYLRGNPLFLLRIARERLATPRPASAVPVHRPHAIGSVGLDVKNRIVLFHPMDPRGQKLGGIETHVRLVLARHPPTTALLFVGIDEVGDCTPGRVHSIDYEGRTIGFLPVARIDAAEINLAARKITRSTTLRFALGALRHLGAIRRAACKSASCEIQRFEFAVFPRLLRLKSVLIVHNEGSRDDKMDSLLKRYWFLHRFNERVALALADRIFAVNTAIARRIEMVSPQAGARTQVMSVSVDIKRFMPTPFDRADDAFHVCFAGRLDDFKDPPLMFSTLARLQALLTAQPAGRFRRVVFDYVGASDPTRFVEFAAIADRTTRHGACRAPEVASIMQRAHAGIITSYFEGMPCFLLEMLASGRPVGAVRLPQFSSLIVDDVSGPLVERMATPDLSADALATAFGELANRLDALDPATIAALVHPYSVEQQMGRLFACHDALATASDAS